MHATRIVTFLLGGWILCTLAVDAAGYLNRKLPERVMANPPPEAEKILKDYGPEQAGLLLRHFAAESNRYFLSRWERLEILAGLVLIPLILIATDRKPIPAILAGLMLVLVAFQYFAIGPELAYRGRAVDFPPGSASVAAQERLWAITEMFVGTEVAVVVVGGVLAAYVASYKSRRRMRGDAALMDDFAKPRI